MRADGDPDVHASEFLASRFVFMFGSRCRVPGSGFGVRAANAGTEPEPEHEPRRKNIEA